MLAETKSIYRKEYKKLINALVDARKKADLTQVELAQKLKKPQSFVSKYESLDRRLDVIEFVEIAEHIGAKYQKLIQEALS